MESGCSGRAALGEGCVFLSFNVTWGWEKFHKDNMPENINGGNFLSHSYISTHTRSKRHE